MVQLAIFMTHCTSAVALLVIACLQLKYLSTSITLAQLARLLRIDVSYSWAALIAIVSGVMLWLLRFEAPGNLLLDPWFQLKLGLFVLAAIASVYPSMTFLRLKRGGLSARMALPRPVIWVVRAEVVILLITFTVSLLTGLDDAFL